MTGIAPTTETTLGPTALCAHCATLIRWWPERGLGDDLELGAWRHCAILETEHTAEPMPELVARAMDGDR